MRDRARNEWRMRNRWCSNAPSRKKQGYCLPLIEEALGILFRRRRQTVRCLGRVPQKLAVLIPELRASILSDAGAHCPGLYRTVMWNLCFSYQADSIREARTCVLSVKYACCVPSDSLTILYILEVRKCNPSNHGIGLVHSTFGAFGGACLPGACCPSR